MKAYQLKSGSFRRYNANRALYLSLIRYFGGKYVLTPKILVILGKIADALECNGYAEITAGGARTLLNLPRNRYSYKLYNEFDLGLCRLFTCVQSQQMAGKLINMLEELHYDKQLFDYSKEHRSDTGIDCLTSGALTYICAMQSRNADLENFKLGGNEQTNIAIMRQYYNQVKRIARITPALQGVDIICGDFRNLLESFNGNQKIMKFLDPPYHPVTRAKGTLNIYPCELTIADHQEMVSILEKDNAWILCGYDPAQYGSDDYKPLEESGAKKISLGYVHRPSSGKSGYESKKEEFLWVKGSIEG